FRAGLINLNSSNGKQKITLSEGDKLSVMFRGEQREMYLDNLGVSSDYVAYIRSEVSEVDSINIDFLHQGGSYFSTIELENLPELTAGEVDFNVDDNTYLINWNNNIGQAHKLYLSGSCLKIGEADLLPDQNSYELNLNELELIDGAECSEVLIVEWKVFGEIDNSFGAGEFVLYFRKWIDLSQS
ncbi:MAG: hypothetical protein V7785_19945, partial [Bermanella sp.]